MRYSTRAIVFCLVLSGLFLSLAAGPAAANHISSANISDTCNGYTIAVSGGDLNVLLANRVHDIARGEILRGDFVGVEPDAHGVVA